MIHFKISESTDKALMLRGENYMVYRFIATHHAIVVIV